MRIAFVHTLIKLAQRNKKIMLLTGDLGYSVFEEYIQKFPDQYINMGVAEQNMTGMAAGMALEGRIPIIYSIAPFVTMRNFEQIRNDICYQNANVKIVGVGAGFSYGPYGHTHHALEDIGIMRTLGNMRIYGPGDPTEVEMLTESTITHIGPVYLRLGKAGETRIQDDKSKIIPGKAFVIQDGKDITLIGTSTLLYRAYETAKKLKLKFGISVKLVSMHTIKPLDEEAIIASARTTKAIFTIEEHSIIGGLGSAVAEVLAENNISIIFKRIGVPDRFTKVMGKQEYMRKANNLGVDQIVNTIMTQYKK